jgi:ring-1,2-phenylacetyl-CoA epoxidase subunit PaaE
VKRFHSLTVASKRNESRDAVRLAIDVPEELRAEFEFLPGQHLPVRIREDGKALRRTYSICSPPGHWPLEIGVRVQPGGRFSEYVANDLQAGDQLDVMPPFGRFHATPSVDSKKAYVGFAAGSGITPILSIAAAVLREEAHSRFTLFYGNRKQSTTMFIDDLYALKNRYPDRLQLHFVFSQEEQEFPIAAGRLDAEKVRELWRAFCRGTHVDEVYICGPDTMISDVGDALLELGMRAENVHSERFGVPKRVAQAGPIVASADSAAITIIIDGHKKSFEMSDSDENIVDAAAEHGIDLPYSCKGGVCATCRCHVRDGAVTMATNYGLEPWEVDAGFVLACQSRPVSKAVTLDYDKI